MDILRTVMRELSADAIKRLARDLDTQREKLLAQAAELEEREKRRRELERNPVKWAPKPAELQAVRLKVRNLRILRMAWRGYTDTAIAKREKLSRSWVNQIVRRGIEEAALHEHHWGDRDGLSDAGHGVARLPALPKTPDSPLRSKKRA